MAGLRDDCSGMTFAFEAALPAEKDHATVMSEKKKREVCQNFQTGSCTLGDACPLRHIQTASKTMHLEVCRHWLRGACVNGENCLYLHEFVDRLVPECGFYQRFGECTNPECFYRHVHPDEKNPKCAAYERGFCPLGPDCEFRHVKKELCPHYMAGFCPLGEACKKGHPKDKLHDRHTVLQRLRERLTIERAGDSNFSARNTCYNCFDPGHLPKDCPGVPNGYMFRALSAVHEPKEKRTFKSSGRLTCQHCFFCAEEDHQIKNCPKHLEVKRQQMAANRPFHI